MATEYTKLAEKLPPGWDCKYDQSTGKCYYINYLTKAMQLEDPRMRYKQLQNERCSTESIPMQPLHGSPYHVYPASNFPAAIRAFQGPNPSLYNVSSSPLLPAKTQQQMEMSPVLRHGSPQTPRLGNGSNNSNNSSLRLQAMQETSFTNQLQFEADAIVAKINNMFPTASENHIRLLLKKYLKSIFPKADETLLFDILANSDNNVQSASEKLLAMGYVKREVSAPRLSNRVKELQQEGAGPSGGNDTGRHIPLQPKILTPEERNAVKVRLQNRYSSIAERIVLMALESVDYSEDRASQILDIVMKEDESKATATGGPREKTTKSDDAKKDQSQSVPDRNTPRGSTDTVLNSEHKKNFESIVGRVGNKGPNPDLCKGPNDEILLADYVTWNGANPDISQGRKGLSSGTDSNLLSDRNYTTHGHNGELCKGPKVGLAKGSIYSQVNINVKCN